MAYAPSYFGAIDMDYLAIDELGVLAILAFNFCHLIF
jgi:hypothetical protein